MNDAMIQDFKIAIRGLLSSPEPAVTHAGAGLELELAYIPPARPELHHHRLWLSRPGGRVTYDESQAAMTALMAAIHAAGHAIAEPGIDMAMDQAKAGTGEPDYATRYEWRLYRQLPLPLVEGGKE